MADRKVKIRITRFNEPITVAYRKSGGGYTVCLEPHRDFVMSSAQLEKIIPNETIQARLFKCSYLLPRLAPFHIQAPRKGSNRLLFYNGSGGYGDQIISWPVAKWLHDQGYEVHILSDPGNAQCWYCFPWVKTIQVLPLPYDMFKMFDHHVILEHVSNRDEHPDQLHPVDAMFNAIGVDPRTVSPLHKVVEPLYTWSEQQSIQAVCPDKAKLGLFQLTSANSVRAMLPNDTAFLLLKLAQATPEVHWLALFDEFNLPEYVKALACRECAGRGTQPLPEAKPVAGEEAKPVAPEPCATCNGSKTIAPNIEPYCASNLRELWALARARASIVVAPDSMMVHVAGCQGVPCVGLWGPVSPVNRTAYYKGHHAIFHREVCPHAPCFSYTADFPRYCPPRGTKRTVCEVMAAVTPSEVIAAVKQIMR